MYTKSEGILPSLLIAYICNLRYTNVDYAFGVFVVTFVISVTLPFSSNVTV